MKALTTREIHKTGTLTILQRVAGRDKTAARDCIDVYGNFVWTLARKFTRSRVEAARVTEEIFIDIWQHCASDCNTQSVEEKLIARIALRRLIKFSRQIKRTSVVSRAAQDEKRAETGGISEYV